MQKTHKEELKCTAIIVDSIVCNNCGQEFIPKNIGQYYQHSQIQNIKLNYGIFDLTTYEFDLCKNCLEDIISKFKIPVIKT